MGRGGSVGPNAGTMAGCPCEALVLPHPTALTQVLPRNKLSVSHFLISDLEKVNFLKHLLLAGILELYFISKDIYVKLKGNLQWLPIAPGSTILPACHHLLCSPQPLGVLASPPRPLQALGFLLLKETKSIWPRNFAFSEPLPGTLLPQFFGGKASFRGLPDPLQLPNSAPPSMDTLSTINLIP